jgi:hypothetical protein
LLRPGDQQIARAYQKPLDLKSPTNPYRLYEQWVKADSTRDTKTSEKTQIVLAKISPGTISRARQDYFWRALQVKELVLKNFAGLPADQMLERMIELSLYAEEKLKSG